MESYTMVQAKNTEDGQIYKQYVKQKASIKWLLSKAYNNKIPDMMKEPFYMDHKQQEHLKPAIVYSLASAELYCLTLANIYLDPNYHNLNQGGIIQFLARKGVISDAQLTETALIQTTPLKIGIHLTIIDGIMMLYAKETATSDRIITAVYKFYVSDINRSAINRVLSLNYEQALLLWINEAVSALKNRITEQAGNALSYTVKEIKNWPDLWDGVALALLISFYYPDQLSWEQVEVCDTSNISNSVHNFQLIYDVCQSLYCNVFHMVPKDILYVKEMLHCNLIALVTDLFSVLEIHSAGYAQIDKANNESNSIVHAKSDHIERFNSNTITKKNHINSSNQGNHKEQFVVHRREGVYISRSIDKTSFNNTLRSGNKCVTVTPAGKSSHTETASGYNISGRRTTRRNSIADDSQLTIENFGGSQDSLYIISNNSNAQGFGSNLGNSSSNQSYENSPINSTTNQSYGNSSVISTTNQSYGNPENLSGTQGYENTLETSISNQSHRNNSVNSKSNHSYGNNFGNLTSNQIYGNNPGNSISNQSYGNNPGNSTCIEGYENPINYSRNQNYGNSISNQSYENNPINYTSNQNYGNNPGNSTNVQNYGDNSGNLTNVQNYGNNSGNSASIQSCGNNLGNPTNIQYFSTNPGNPVNVQNFSQNPGNFTNLRNFSSNPGNFVNVQSYENNPGYPSHLQSFGNSPGNNNVQSYSSSPVNYERLPRNLSNLHSFENPNNVRSFGNNTENNQLGSNDIITTFSQVSPRVIQQAPTQIMRQSSVQVSGSPQAPPRPLRQLSSQVSQQSQTQAILQAPLQPVSHSPSHMLQSRDLSNELSQTLSHVSSYKMQHAPVQILQQSPPNVLQQSPPHSPPKSLPQTLQSPPRTITWQHQHYKQSSDDGGSAGNIINKQDGYGKSEGICVMGSEMLNIRLKLEEKRRQIESEKRRAEANLNHQRQKLGKAIFFQTVSNKDMLAPEKKQFTEEYANEVNQPHIENLNTKNNDQNSNIIMTKMRQSSVSHDESEGNAFIRDNVAPEEITSHQVNSVPTVTCSPLNMSPRAVTCSPLNTSPRTVSRASNSSISSPSADDMAPQCISFIGNEEKQSQLTENFNKIQITSGNKTYRIPSPTKHHAPISHNSFGNARKNDVGVEKGFYVSFDDDTHQVRPKPPLREKKLVKKEQAMLQALNILPEVTKVNDRSVDHIPIVHRNITKESIPESSIDSNNSRRPIPSAVVASTDENNLCDPNVYNEMERKKERILMMSLQRRQQQEEMRVKKEYELQQKKEQEKLKEEAKSRKREEEKQRRAAILQQHRLKKALEEAENQGQVVDKDLLNSIRHNLNGGPPKLRERAQPPRPRPKTIHISNRTNNKSDTTDGGIMSARGRKGSSSNLSEISTSSMKRDYYRGSQDFLLADASRTSNSSISSDIFMDQPGCRLGRPKFGMYQNHPRKSNSLMNLCGINGDQDSFMYKYRDTDSGLGRATPQRGLSPSHPTSPSGPGSLPVKKRFDDTASESGGSEYSGPRLYKQPATKSNRGIILNAVEYCVFPGVVNKDGKRRLLEEINSTDTKHFLILFRDTRFQFRALYSYFPENDEIIKLYGTGPKIVTDRMFDKFFKYNSGGKCFSQVHTKHLSVTIDAFTIHNILWQGKKANLPNKRDMALVI